MLREPIPFIRSTLESLRAVFLGSSSRHNATQTRWVIAEMGYNEFLMGPNQSDWSQENWAGLRGFTLRMSNPVQVSVDEQAQILKERPDAKFGSFDGDAAVFYIPPLINSNFIFRGHGGGFSEFIPLSRDAGFCLLHLLQFRPLAIKLPELVPYDAIAGVRSVSTSTNMPTDLTERWLAFLHVLGWQKIPFSPLRAIRSIWHGNSSFQVDPAELQKAVATPLFENLRSKFPIPPRYFESTLDTDVHLASVHAIDVLLSGLADLPTVDVNRYITELASIKPGKEAANRFHALALEILTISLAPDLHSPASEEKLHEGRGRIDIVFMNAAERGYFADLPFRHNLVCPVVFFECKNYSSDVTGPDFAQLMSRFSDRRSKVGFIVCRTIEDREAVEKRCRDRFHDNHEHIVVLGDSDLIEILKMKSVGDSEGISRYFHAKFRPMFMDS